MSLLQAHTQLELIAHYVQSFGRALRQALRRQDQYRYELTYAAWFAMIRRCSNPEDKDYRNYGGRGIKVDPRWQGRLGFTYFLLDMGPKPKRLILDRIDTDGDYTPSNCRWITYQGSANNRRNNRKVTLYGVEMSFQEACRLYDINPTTAYQRLFVIPRPWTPERAFTTPTAKGYQEYVREVATRKAARQSGGDVSLATVSMA